MYGEFCTLELRKLIENGFCHLAIEKGLKGIYQKRLNTIPPKIHNLIFFVRKLELAAPIEVKRFLVLLNDASIPTRYPSGFKDIYKEFTVERAQTSIEKAREF